MKNRIYYLRKVVWLFLALLFLRGPLLAEEKVIQNEKMSFEQCIKVISVSEDKLSVAPKVSNPYDEKRVAVFELSDGKLTITCDGENGFVIVSTQMN